MAGEKCPYSPNTCGLRGENCLLITTLMTRSTSGGNPAEGDTDSGSGPYWRKDRWFRFSEKATQVADAVGCLARNNIHPIVTGITQGKVNRGELI